MFMHEGIVCAALSFVLMGGPAWANQTKPSDLPLDPRVVCQDGDQEPLPVPTRERSGPEKITVEPISPAPIELAEPTSKKKSEAYCFGLGYELRDGLFLNYVHRNETGQKVQELRMPLNCPVCRLVEWAVNNVWETVSESLGCCFIDRPNVFQVDDGMDDEDEGDSTTVPPILLHTNKPRPGENVDPVYLEMLRSTQPLNLPPVQPAHVVLPSIVRLDD